jgi:hypothetical protein
MTGCILFPPNPAKASFGGVRDPRVLVLKRITK